jgi:glutathione S-transferase
MIKLYESAVSGNCYKVRLLLAQIGVPFQRVPVDIVKGETRTPEFLARVPFGRVPAAELEDGTVLAESNAMLCYFAEGTPLLPADRRGRAEVLQWLFWEQYDHEPYVAVPRAWLTFFGVPAGKERELADRQARGYKALDVLERRLAGHPFLAADRYTVADIALYAYTHVAGEGQIDLTGYRAVRAWLERVRAQERHVAIDQ